MSSGVIAGSGMVWKKVAEHREFDATDKEIVRELRYAAGTRGKLVVAESSKIVTPS